MTKRKTYTKETPGNLELLKKLKMKYFWQQKATETSVFFASLVCLWYISYYLGMLFINTLIKYKGMEGYCKLMGDLDHIVAKCIEEATIHSWEYLVWGFIIILGIFLILVLIRVTIKPFVQWNLEKAEKRAKAELGFKPRGYWD